MRVRLSLLPSSAPLEGGGAAICPHCWMVNPGMFLLCARCGADMRTYLQESAGLRRTAPLQSPVPVLGGPRLSALQRVLLGGFLLVLALGQVLSATAPRQPVRDSSPSPASAP